MDVMSAAYTVTGYLDGSPVPGAAYTTGTLPSTGSTTTSFNPVTLPASRQNIDRRPDPLLLRFVIVILTGYICGIT